MNSFTTTCSDPRVADWCFVGASDDGGNRGGDLARADRRGYGKVCNDVSSRLAIFMGRVDFAPTTYAPQTDFAHVLINESVSQYTRPRNGR